MAIIKPNNNTISAITALPAAIPTGKVLQVQHQEITTLVETTSTSFTSSFLTNDSFSMMSFKIDVALVFSINFDL